MRLLLASNNAKKLAELRALLALPALSLLPQGELGIAEAEEPHGTFIENALAKARHAARQGGGAAIADDSGLCVDALGGAPGVLSAVFAPSPAEVRADESADLPADLPADLLAEGPAGAPADREAQRRRQDAANNRLLLQRLHGVADRRAAFVCTLVALRHADDPQPLVACGRWAGQILEAPSGQGGFGYDPLMFIPSLGRSVAALDAGVKNLHSHRALAALQMRALLQEVWHLGRP
jgi:XTP/dITP diphosphohydrolase